MFGRVIYLTICFNWEVVILWQGYSGIHIRNHCLKGAEIFIRKGRSYARFKDGEFVPFTPPAVGETVVLHSRLRF